MNEATLSEKATRVRYSMLALLCFLAMITYMDRAVNGNAKADMMAAVGKTEDDFFPILIAFQLAYALFEIPSGWMGDTFGPRATLLRVVLWWTFFVALTGFTGMVIPGFETVLIGYTTLIGVQFLFGMGEAGAFPNIARAIYNWFPATQRGFAQGAVWLSARLMGGFTPLLWVLLVGIGGLDWRQALWIFAGVALIWCLLFAYWFRNTPSEHPSVNAAELTLINSGKAPPPSHSNIPWRKIFTSRNVWGLCLMYTVTNFNWYFLMYYLPQTLKGQFPQFNNSDGGKIFLALLAGAPLLIGMVGCLLGGWLSDRYIRKTGDRKWGRRLYGMIGYGMAGVCYLLATAFIGNIWAFAICLILVGFFNDLIMGPSWAAAQDIGGNYSAIVSGTMNMIGNLGAALGNAVTGIILSHHSIKVINAAGKTVSEIQPSGFTVCFIMFGIVYGLGVLSWLLIDPSRPIEEDAH